MAYTSSLGAVPLDIGRLARIAASAFGDVSLRGCMGLGDAWTDYVRTGSGPPGGRITSPNGDVIVFDQTGGPDYAFPHAGSGLDADVEHDTNSPFYGWSNLQKAAYGAAQGVVVASDALRAAAKFDPVTGKTVVPQSAIDASQARLATLAVSDPVVAAALSNLAAGIHQGINDPASLAAAAKRAADDKAAQDAYNAAEIAWYAAGHRGAYPGPTSSPAVTNVMATTTAADDVGHATLAPTITFDPTTGSGPYLAPAAPIVDYAPMPAAPSDSVWTQTQAGSRITAALNSPLGYAVTALAIAGGVHLLKRRRRRARR